MQFSGDMGAQATFEGTLVELHNFWQHCTNNIMSIKILPSPDHPYNLALTD